MVHEADEHAAEASRMRELAEARNQAETLVYTTEKTLKEHRDSVDAETVSTIESRMEELRGMLESEDAGAIRAKAESLTEASHKLAEAVYQKAQTAQQTTPPGGNGSAGEEQEDEIVEDAEYEVVDEEAKQS